MNSNDLVDREASDLMNWRQGAALKAISYYRAYSSMRPPRCRFFPTCSSYAHEAIETHGFGRGSWLATKRICKCHPLGSHGFDPVPDRGI